MDKTVKLSGVIGMPLFNSETGKRNKRTSFKIHINDLEKFMKHSGHIKDLRFEDAYITKGSKEIRDGGNITYIPITERLSEKEISQIKETYFKKEERELSKDEENILLKEELAEMKKMIKELSSKKLDDDIDELQDLRNEYAELSGKEPDSRWKEKKLKTEIEKIKA